MYVVVGIVEDIGDRFIVVRDVFVQLDGREFRITGDHIDQARITVCLESCPFDILGTIGIEHADYDVHLTLVEIEMAADDGTSCGGIDQLLASEYQKEEGYHQEEEGEAYGS